MFAKKVWERSSAFSTLTVWKNETFTLIKKFISLNQLNTFTKFLPKLSEREFSKFPHCDTVKEWYFFRQIDVNFIGLPRENISWTAFKSNNVKSIWVLSLWLWRPLWTAKASKKMMKMLLSPGPLFWIVRSFSACTLKWTNHKPCKQLLTSKRIKICFTWQQQWDQ